MIFGIWILILLKTFFFFSFLQVPVFKWSRYYFLFISFIISAVNILILFLIIAFSLLSVLIIVIRVLQLFFSWISRVLLFFVRIIVLAYIPQSFFETVWSLSLILVILFIHREINLGLVFDSSFLMKTLLKRHLAAKWSVHKGSCSCESIIVCILVFFVS